MFSGWTDYTKISKDTDVWPRFGGSIYKVEFLDWDGTVISQTGFTNPQYVEDGKSATPPQTDPVREGYTFDGWTPDYHNVSKDLTVIAKYTDKSLVCVCTQSEFYRDAVCAEHICDCYEEQPRELCAMVTPRLWHLPPTARWCFKTMP